jgi:hypothetical protein
MSEAKVFCKDCRHIDANTLLATCDHPNTFDHFDDPVKGPSRRWVRTFCYEKNKSLHCPDFEPRKLKPTRKTWWRFW